MMTKNNQELIELMEGLGFTLHEHGVMFLQGTRGLVCMEIAQKILNEVKKSELRGAFTNMEWVIETLKRSGHDDESIAIYEKINKDNVKRINVLEQEGK